MYVYVAYHSELRSRMEKGSKLECNIRLPRRFGIYVPNQRTKNKYTNFRDYVLNQTNQGTKKLQQQKHKQQRT